MIYILDKPQISVKENFEFGPVWNSSVLQFEIHIKSTKRIKEKNKNLCCSKTQPAYLG